MRAYLTLTCLLFHLICIAQNDGYVDHVEQVLRDHVFHVNTDSIVSKIRENILNYSRKKSDLLYNTDYKYKTEIDKIDQMGISVEDYRNNSNYIKTYLTSEKNLAKKNGVNLYFQNNFLHELDTAIQKIIVGDASSQTNEYSQLIQDYKSGKIALKEVGLAWEQLGDFTFENSIYRNCLVSYLTASAIYDSLHLNWELANIELKIGQLFGLFEFEQFKSKSIEFYSKAATHYFQIGDSSDGIICQLLACEIRAWQDDPEVLFEDVLGYNYENFNKNKDYKIPDLSKQKKVEARELIILTIGSVIDKFNINELNTDAQYYLWRTIGSYFAKKGEYQVARKYYEASLTELTNPDNHVKFDDITLILNYLSWVNSNLNNEKEMRKYNYLEEDLKKNATGPYGRYWTILSRADYLNNLNIMSESIELSRKILDSVKKSNELESIKMQLAHLAYKTLITSYKKIGLNDSVNYFYAKDDAINNEFTNEGNELLKVEAEFNEDQLDNKIEKQHTIIHGNLLEIQNYRKKISIFKYLLQQSKDSLNHIIYLTEIFKNKNQELITKGDSLSGENKLLEALLKIKSSSLKDMSKENNQIRKFSITIVSSIVMILLVVSLFSHNRIKQRNIRIEQGKQEISQRDQIIRQNIKEAEKVTEANKTEISLLKHKADYLAAAARAKIHDIRSNLNKVNAIIPRDPNLATNYLSKADNYHRSLLNSFNVEKWTINSEICMMNEFYQAESLIRQPVIFKIDHPEISKYTTKFMQDVLPALLHNSMKYGFKNNSNTRNHFEILIQRKDDLLLFEIRDNGVGRNPKLFFPPDTTNHAIGILRERIVTILAQKNISIPTEEAFKIMSSKETGTIINFYYPYEQV